MLKLRKINERGYMMNENIGCLGSILNALGLLPKQNKQQINKTENIFPYALRDDFLSVAELNFL